VVWAVPNFGTGTGSGGGEPRRSGAVGQGRRRRQPGALGPLWHPGHSRRQGLPRWRGRQRIRRRRAKAKVEELFDSLVPSRADELLAAGDELSLREASELEPRRADIAVALARKRLERGAEDDALSAVEGHEGDFGAQGIAARIGLTRAGLATEAFEALDNGDRAAALDALLDAFASADEGTREQLRRAAVGILGELEPGDPEAIRYRRRLATALY
jgi:hypothetical protein